MPVAFGTNRPARPLSPFQVAIGTFGESLADEATFGLIQPQIISPAEEKSNAVASAIGHVAGSIVGMIPSFGAAGLASKVLRAGMNGFRWSRKAYAAAEAVAATMPDVVPVVGKLATPAIESFGHTVPMFAIHSAAREFITQVKSADPEWERIGNAALQGGLTGFFTGTAASAFAASNPFKQALSFGAAMSVAETINDAGDGEDVMSRDYFLSTALPTFFTGAAFGLFNSRGWKERRDYQENKSIEAVFKEAHEFGVFDENGRIKDETVIPTVMKYLEKNGIKPVDAIKDIYGSQYAEATRYFMNKWEGQILPSRRGKVNQIHALTNKMGLEEQGYRDLLYSITGKRSTKDMSNDELGTVMQEINKAVSTTPVDVANRFKMGLPIVSSFTSPDQAMVATGFSEYAEVPRAAKLLSLIAKDRALAATYSWEQRWTRDWKKVNKNVKGEAEQLGVAIGRATVEGLTGRKTKPTEAMKDLWNRLDSEIQDKGLNPQMKQVFQQIKTYTDVIFARVNAARIAVGEEPLTKHEFYVRHSVDRPALLREGRSRTEIAGTQQYVSGKRPLPFAEKSIEKARVTDDLPYVKNPFAMIRQMANQAYDIIYLEEPHKIARSQLAELRKVEGIQPGVLNQFEDYLEYSILQRPRQSDQAIQHRMVQFLETNKVGKVLDTMLAKVDIDAGGNPVKAFSQVWGNLAGKAFLGFKPKLALLNSLQWTYSHGFVSEKNMLKAIMTSDSPALLKRISENNTTLIAMRSHAEETLKAAPNGLDRAAFEGFTKSSIRAIEKTEQALFYQTMEYFWNPKYHKLGWATKEGIDKRTKLRNAKDPKWQEALAPEEYARLGKELAYSVQHANFMYNILGSPQVTQSSLGKVAFNLSSFPMHYGTEYLSELTYRAFNGSPRWDSTKTIKLPLQARLGIAKHFVGLGVLAAMFEKAFGVDYSNMSGAGVLDFRPSPAVSMFLSVKDSFSDDAYTKARARTRLKSSIPIPYSGVYRDTKRSITEETGAKGMLFYQKYEPKKSKKSTTAHSPFGKTTSPFRQFKAFEQ